MSVSELKRVLLNGNGQGPEEERREACAVVGRMSCEEAGKGVELLHALSDDDRVKNVFLLRGRLLDKLEDAAKMTPQEREEKWSAEEEKWRKESEEHTLRVEEEEERRSRRERNKETNKKMLEVERREGKGNEVWNLSHDALSSKPPSFWSSLRIDSLTERETRLCLAGVVDFAEKRGRTAIPEPVWRRVDDALERLPPPNKPFVARGRFVSSPRPLFTGSRTIARGRARRTPSNRCERRRETAFWTYILSIARCFGRKRDSAS